MKIELKKHVFDWPRLEPNVQDITYILYIKSENATENDLLLNIKKEFDEQYSLRKEVNRENEKAVVQKKGPLLARLYADGARDFFFVFNYFGERESDIRNSHKDKQEYENLVKYLEEKGITGLHQTWEEFITNLIPVANEISLTTMGMYAQSSVVIPAENVRPVSDEQSTCHIL